MPQRRAVATSIGKLSEGARLLYAVSIGGLGSRSPLGPLRRMVWLYAVCARGSVGEATRQTPADEASG